MWFVCFLLSSTCVMLTGEEMILDECDYYTPRGKSWKLTNCAEQDLTTVPKDIFKTKAKFIMLATNPYNCDCDMTWFMKRLHRKDFSQILLDYKDMECQKPAHLKGRKIYLLKEKDVCNPNRPVDACKLKNNKCHRYADCSDLDVGYLCSCKTGFSGNGRQCLDIDECYSTHTHKCPPHSKCVNTLGTYSCACNKGYLQRNRMCEDINECRDDADRCHKHAICENTPGSYHCTCKPGYHGENGRNCVLEVGKSCSSSPCFAKTEECFEGNRPGKFECRCRMGFARNRHYNCEDIDECMTNINPCDPVAECHNTVGSYKCVCPKGYSIYGRKCIDIDECENGGGDCHHYAACVNTIGAFSCVCRQGFEQYEHGRVCLKQVEAEKFDTVPIIVGTCVFVMVVIGSLALFLYVRQIRQQKSDGKNEPLVNGAKPKRPWFPNMFPEANIDRIPVNESVLTVWSDSDEEETKQT